MGTLLLSMFLVTVYQCYGHYPPRSAIRVQGESTLTLDQSVVTSIANNFDWNIIGQYQSTQQGSEPDVVVMIIEYQSDEGTREEPPPPSPHHGWRPPHHGRHPAPPPAQPRLPQTTSNGNPMFWYHQMQQTHYGYEKPRVPSPPFIQQQYSQHNYGSQYFEHQNPGINSGYDNFGTHTNQRPSTQYEGNYDNNQYNDGSNQFNENRPVDQKPGYYSPELGNQNQFNQNSQWYPNNINQGVGSDQQNPNNGGLISGTQNPINTIPDDVISQLFPIKPTSPTIDNEAEAPENTTTESEIKKPEEEEEDFKIDIRFKAE